MTWIQGARVSADRPLVVRLLPVLDFGGVESMVVTQAALMDPERFRFRVCGFDGDGVAARQMRELGVRVDVLHTSPSVRNPDATRRLFRYLRTVRPDVLHCSIAEANVHGLLAGAAAGVPARIAEEVGMPSHGTLGRLAFAGLYRSAQSVVALSEAIREYLINTDGAPPERVRVIYPCANGEFFPEARPAPTRRASGEPFRFLTVGRLAPVKNQMALLRAVAVIAERHPHIRLDVIGDGPSRNELSALIAKLGIEENVSLLGHRSDVQSHMRGYHAFVLPSLSEGFGIALVEAMASGVPGLASDVGGMREVLGDLADACTLSPTDQRALEQRMEWLISMPDDERVRLARTQQDRAYDRFQPKRFVQEITQAYDDVLRERLAGKRRE